MLIGVVSYLQVGVEVHQLLEDVAPYGSKLAAI
jgi:hypothetical protein